MSSTTEVTKSFTLPKLRSDGSNWILFQDSVELECASHILKNHIDSTGTEPINFYPTVQGQTALTAVQQTTVEEFEKKLEKWVSGEATIQKKLLEALPPALYLTVQKKTTTKKVWDAVVKHHHQKSQLIIVELRHKLQNERCEEKEDVHAHLAKLQQMHNDLASMGEV
jgi:rhamnogalacturonyl hydrolase YesR